jgi:PBSX family phage portal protein
MSAGPALDLAEKVIDAVGRDFSRARHIVSKVHVLGNAGGSVGTLGLPVEITSGQSALGLRTTGGGPYQILEPWLSLDSLQAVAKHSSTLASIIGAYSTNIEQFGYRLEPAIDPESADALRKIKTALRLERQHEAYQSGMLDKLKRGERPSFDLAMMRLEVPEPSTREAKRRLRELVDQLVLQKFLAKRFFDYCTSGYSFEELRARKRKELEETGNAFWEVSRNGLGEIARFSHLPVQTMRLLTLHTALDTTEVESLVPISPIRFERVTETRTFRRYAQLAAMSVSISTSSVGAYFKSFGDPRVMSSRTGKYFKTEDELRQIEGPAAKPATEVIHFSIFDSTSPYGVPRWIGNLMSLLGTQAAEYVNFSYFDNKSVPPMALLVSGGRLSKPSTERIESFVENHLKGRANFHKILIIEAVPHKSASTGQEAPIKLTLVPLIAAQQRDGQFLLYARMNRMTTRQSMRMYASEMGSAADEQAGRETEEEQVYQPERQIFDSLINREIMPEIGAVLWRFVSNAPVTRDPMKMSTIGATMTRAGILSINEGRELAGDVFNREYPARPEKWANQPMAVTLAEIGADNQPLAQDGVGGGESGDQARVPRGQREQRRTGMISDQTAGAGVRANGNAAGQSKGVSVRKGKDDEDEPEETIDGLPVERVAIGVDDMAALFDPADEDPADEDPADEDPDDDIDGDDDDAADAGDDDGDDDDNDGDGEDGNADER